VAVTNAPRGFAARLKEGTGADKEASGATRVAGTANFKPAYAPNFPRVLIDADQPGLRVTTQTLDAMDPRAGPADGDPPWSAGYEQMAQLRALPRRGARAAIPSAPARILSGARSRSPGATASKRPPNGCWKKAPRPARTAKPMPGKPPSMPTTPPGNATPCHGGDRPGVRRGRRCGDNPSLRAPRESATAGRERVFPARASPLGVASENGKQSTLSRLHAWPRHRAVAA
jgi:hypothetical protein